MPGSQAESLTYAGEGRAHTFGVDEPPGVSPCGETNPRPPTRQPRPDREGCEANPTLQEWQPASCVVAPAGLLTSSMGAPRGYNLAGPGELCAPMDVAPEPRSSRPKRTGPSRDPQLA